MVEDHSDRRRPTVPALKQPVRPATMVAHIGTRDLLEPVDVVTLTDRTIVVEVADSTTALALSVLREITVVVDLGGGEQTFLARPGRRSSDNPTSRQVELVFHEDG